jgi:hypothetical protein
VSLRVLVCGGRAFSDWWKLCTILDALHITEGIGRLVHGDAVGADRMADNWAYWRGVPVGAYPIRRGRESGYQRNQRMLNREPVDLVVAFPGGSGTADMVRRAQRAGIVVKEIP